MKKAADTKKGGTITVAHNVTEAILRDIIGAGKPRDGSVKKHEDYLSQLAKPRISKPMIKQKERNSQYNEETRQKPKASSLVRKKKPPPVHPLEKMFGPFLIGQHEEKVQTDSLAQGEAMIGVYFSAHWCPPCHTFTPLLKILHDSINQASHGASPGASRLHVVFVSMDMHQDSFNQYFSRMPWLAVDFGDEGRREQLVADFGVRGIPNFQMLNPRTMEVYRRNGRELVMKDPHGEHFPWVDIEPLENKKPMEIPPLVEEMEKDKRVIEKIKNIEEKLANSTETDDEETHKVQFVEASEPRATVEPISGGESETERTAVEQKEEQTEVAQTEVAQIEGTNA